MARRDLMDRIDGACKTLATVVGWGLLGMAVLVSVDVFGRKVFAISTQGSDEIGGYVMAITCAFGFSYTLATRTHIRLNVLLPHLPLGLRVAANCVAYAVLTAFSYMMLWRGASVLMESAELQAVAPTPLATPLVIPQGLWVAGLAWFAFQLTVYFAKVMCLAFRGGAKELDKRFGVETVEDEVSELLEDPTVVGRGR
jgi:TRAP-type C4-dicarboxylate transport system permease small subunit